MSSMVRRSRGFTDNVLIAIIAASAVTVSAICVLGGGAFAFIANSKGFEALKKRVDDSKQTILAEMKALRIELLAEMRQHIAEYHK